MAAFRDKSLLLYLTLYNVFMAVGYACLLGELAVGFARRRSGAWPVS